MRGGPYTKKLALYALYKNDTFIDVGTAEELADRMGCDRKYIQLLSTPSIHKRAEGNNWILAHKVGSVIYARKTYQSPWVEKCVI